MKHRYFTREFTSESKIMDIVCECGEILCKVLNHSAHSFMQDLLREHRNIMEIRDARQGS